MDRRLLRALLLFPLVGCERVVGVTLPATQTRLVVEARLERPRDVTATGRQEVHLTTTDSYFSKTTPPAVRGATVRVADDSGRVVAFTESTTRPGWYETNGLIISVGRKYTLRITWLGDEYVSTETALPSVAIDSLYFSKRTGDVGPVDGLRATISLQDPEGVRNFYLWDQFIDGRRLVSFDSLSFTRAVTSDDIFDGG